MIKPQRQLVECVVTALACQQAVGQARFVLTTQNKCVAEAARVAAGHDARAILAEAIGGVAVGAAGGLAGSAGGPGGRGRHVISTRTDTAESFCDQLYATTTALP
jgi:hypothetical protein